jgi:hypothetical protein
MSAYLTIGAKGLDLVSCLEPARLISIDNPREPGLSGADTERLTKMLKTHLGNGHAYVYVCSGICCA